MKTNWLKVTNDINRKRFQIPPGWETRDQVAASLQCAPERVADLLKPGIQSGDIEKEDFATWDEKRRVSVRVTCYREKNADGEAPEKPTASASLEARIIAKIHEQPTASNSAIAAIFRRQKLRAGDVARVREAMR